MLTVERKEAPKRTTQFENLPIGEVYRDEDGHIAIKVSNNDKENCLTLGWDDENEWALTSENLRAEVTPPQSKFDSMGRRLKGGKSALLIF